MAKCKNCKNLIDTITISADGEHEFKWCGIKADCPDTEMERDCEHYKNMTDADCQY